MKEEEGKGREHSMCARSGLRNILCFKTSGGFHRTGLWVRNLKVPQSSPAQHTSLCFLVYKLNPRIYNYLPALRSQDLDQRGGGGRQGCPLKLLPISSFSGDRSRGLVFFFLQLCVCVCEEKQTLSRWKCAKGRRESFLGSETWQ